ncbi:MAG: tRNA adenosine(34) deaminase TadA [Chlamydiota bacterium]
MHEKKFVENAPQKKSNIFYMQEALREARIAFAAGEVPVGAVVVHAGRIIGRGHNQVEMLRDATAHAEMIALSAASAHFEDWRLLDTDLYVTLEPCVMCAGALMQCRVKNVFWGASDIRLGAGGSFVDLFSLQHPMHRIAVQGGILAEESAHLLRSFFQERRAKKTEGLE